MSNKKEKKQEHTEKTKQPEVDADEKLEEILEETKETAEELLVIEKDKNLRLFAEFENFRKRTAKERVALFATAGQDIMTILLPILDDMERAIQANEYDEKHGVVLIYNKLRSSLEVKGLKEMESPIGKELNTEAGYMAAKRCALNIIAQAKKACSNDLNKIKSCVKLTGFVNSTDNFIEQPKVINGASDLIASVFGDLGMHTRAAVSTNSLPLGVAVEVDAIFELN